MHGDWFDYMHKDKREILVIKILIFKFVLWFLKLKVSSVEINLINMTEINKQ